MRLKIMLFAALSLGLAVPAQAQDTAGVFKPSGNWTADFGDDYCRLIRTFSDGTNQISLALERTQPGEFTRLVFVGDGLKPYRSAEQLGYQFAPSGAAARVRFVRSETADSKKFLSTDPVTLAPFAGFGAAPADGAAPVVAPYDRAKELATARGMTTLSLTDGLSVPVTFETGSLGPVIEVMQACTDDLVKFWGLDPDQHKTMTAVAVANPVPGSVLPFGTIPFTEFAKFAGGANQVRLMIGADGKPTSCTIYQPTLDAALNDRICKMIMDKATFQPAKDAAGQAMATYWMGPPLMFGPPPPAGFGR